MPAVNDTCVVTRRAFPPLPRTQRERVPVAAPRTLKAVRSDRPPDMRGKRLRRRIGVETAGGLSGTPDAARAYATYGGYLSQPDKQELASLATPRLPSLGRLGTDTTEAELSSPMRAGRYGVAS